MGIFDIFKKKKLKQEQELKLQEEQRQNEEERRIKYNAIQNAEEEFIEFLKQKNWQIKEYKDKNYVSKVLNERYKNIPKEWSDFISKYELFSNHENNFYFLTLKDYDITETEGFRYNEFELISLDALEDDRDEMYLIKKYWNENLPIILSVGGGYEYYAINLNTGKIVYGFEPIFEESSVVADNLEDFMKKVIIGEIKLGYDE